MEMQCPQQPLIIHIDSDQKARTPLHEAHNSTRRTSSLHDFAVPRCKLRDGATYHLPRRRPVPPRRRVRPHAGHLLLRAPSPPAPPPPRAPYPPAPSTKYVAMAAGSGGVVTIFYIFTRFMLVYFRVSLG